MGDAAPYVHKDKRFTGATTGGDVWTPATGKRIVITDLMFTTSEDATVTFWHTADVEGNRVIDGDFAANSGMAASRQQPIELPVDAVLEVTTSAGNLKCTAQGYEY